MVFLTRAEQASVGGEKNYGLTNNKLLDIEILSILINIKQVFLK